MRREGAGARAGRGPGCPEQHRRVRGKPGVRRGQGRPAVRRERGTVVTSAGDPSETRVRGMEVESKKGVRDWDDRWERDPKAGGHCPRDPCRAQEGQVRTQKGTPRPSRQPRGAPASSAAQRRKGSERAGPLAAPGGRVRRAGVRRRLLRPPGGGVGGRRAPRTPAGWPRPGA